MNGALESGVAAGVNYLEFYDTEAINAANQKIYPAVQRVLKAVSPRLRPRVPVIRVPTKPPSQPCGTTCM